MRNRIMSVLLILLSVLILLGVGLTAYMLFNAKDLKPKTNDQTRLEAEFPASDQADGDAVSALFQFT